jgi:hypothetical protein
LPLALVILCYGLDKPREGKVGELDGTKMEHYIYRPGSGKYVISIGAQVRHKETGDLFMVRGYRIRTIDSKYNEQYGREAVSQISVLRLIRCRDKGYCEGLMFQFSECKDNI